MMNKLFIDGSELITDSLFFYLNPIEIRRQAIKPMKIVQEKNRDDVGTYNYNGNKTGDVRAKLSHTHMCSLLKGNSEHLFNNPVNSEEKNRPKKIPNILLHTNYIYYIFIWFFQSDFRVFNYSSKRIFERIWAPDIQSDILIVFKKELWMCLIFSVISFLQSEMFFC